MADRYTNLDKDKQQAREFISQGLMKQALTLLRKLCKTNPHDTESWYMLAGVNANLGNMEDVIHACRKVIEHKPDHALAWYNLGLALHNTEEIEKAVTAYNTALLLQPTMHQAHENLAASLHKIGASGQAMLHCQKAIRLKPDSAVALNTLGILFRELGDIKKALSTFNQAVIAAPNYTEARWNRALAMLKLGQYGAGWDEYEFRWTHEPKMQRGTPYPRWNGAALRGQKLLVYAEQGIGDQIMFASCLKDLERLPCEVTMECESRLAPLLSRAFPFIYVHAGSWDERLPECSREFNHQIPVGSLPRYFRRSVKDFPQHSGYLQPDTNKLALWNSRLHSPKLKIGISWRGGNKDSGGNTRSIPLELWSELLKSEELQIINLQYGDCSDEVSEFNNIYGISVILWDDTDPLRDMDFFAAEISALDLVITVDNSTAHLAGALGVPTWTLLPFVSDWRWEHGRGTTPWYPCMKLYSQETPGDWSVVLDRVSNDLQLLLAAQKKYQ